jgi:hypothetical protein
MADDDEPLAPSEAEVIAIVAELAKKVVRAISAGGSIEESVVRVLLDDQTGGVELMRAAFDSGREDAITSIAGRAGDDGAPDWSDVEGMGERAAIAREDGICGRCDRLRVCVVPRSAPAELFLVVRRCAAFRDA